MPPPAGQPLTTMGWVVSQPGISPASTAIQFTLEKNGVNEAARAPVKGNSKLGFTIDRWICACTLDQLTMAHKAKAICKANLFTHWRVMENCTSRLPRCLPQPARRSRLALKTPKFMDELIKLLKSLLKTSLITLVVMRLRWSNVLADRHAVLRQLT